MEKQDCAFCEHNEVQERAIVKNKLAWAFPTKMPITPGHILICPIRCVAITDELTNDELKELFDLQKKLKPVLKKLFKAEGFNYAWNEGKVAGQSTPHFHLHMVPRKEGDVGITEYEPRKFLYRPGVREDSPEKELQEIARLIRTEFE